ncbi:MAG: diguanylate cyclase [Sulfuricella sp.]|nr:diguanylate cyclase [Sulfuricella sp.]
MNLNPSLIRRKRWQLFVQVLGVMILAEGLMLLAMHWLLPAFGHAYTPGHIVADVGLMSLICAPILWWAIVGPLFHAHRQADDKFRSVVEQSLAGIYIYQGGRLIYANPKLAEIFGYACEEMERISPLDLVAPQDRAKVTENLRRRLDGEVEDIAYSFQGRRKDGSAIEVSVHGRRAVIMGKPAIVGVLLDVTEQHHAIAALRDSETMLREITTVMGEAVYALDRDGHVIFINPAAEQLLGWSKEELLGRHGHETFHHKKPDGSPFPRQECPVFKTIHSGRTYRSEEDFMVRKDGSFLPVTIVSTPLLREGEIVGSVAAFHDITERRQAMERIQYLAHYDALTGLPNRRLLEDRLEQALARAKRNQRSLAVMFLDLDRFKQVNDTLGHDQGDELLKAVAQRLTAAVRQEDTVSRLGGDEFVVVLPEIASAGDAEIAAQKIVEAMRSPVKLENQELHVTTSVGLAVYPQDGGDVVSLMKNADSEMYRAKESGRDRYCIARASSL